MYDTTTTSVLIQSFTSPLSSDSVNILLYKASLPPISDEECSQSIRASIRSICIA